MNDRPHTCRPDGDNLDKFVFDSLNGVLWKDDSLVTVLLRTKTWTADKIGSITIYVKDLPDAPFNYDQLLDDIEENIVIGVV